MTPGRLRDPRWVPLVAGPAVGVISVVESLTAPDFRPFLAPIAVVASWLVVGLVLQTRWPAAGAVITGGFYPVGAALGLPGLTGAGLIALLLACGYAGFAASRFRSWLAVALVTATIVGTELVVHGPSWDMIFLPTVFVVGLAGGRLLSRERVRSAQLLELTRQLEAQREAAERAAVTDERTRISREIHDSVAHSVSVMTLQTGGLRRQLGEVLRDRPQETEILLGLERLGRETVEELRSLVGILRDPDHGEPATTVPSLSRAVELVNDVRAAGLPVELVVAGEPALLPRALDLSAYRILQEALTNVLRHAPGSPTRVTISYGHDAVDLQITNQTTTAVSGSRSAGGHGLVGMGQRAQLFGGTCTAGPVVDGFEVAAHLPLGRISG